MPLLTYSVSVSYAGITVQKAVNREADGGIAVSVSLPAGKAGSLTTRTDNDTGVATLSTGHGIITGDVVDVYWSGGMRYGMSATVATNAVTIDAGLGDNLPIQDTAVVLVKQVIVSVLVDGDELEHLTLSLETSDATLTTKGHAVFEDAAGDDIAELDFTANTPVIYDIAAGVSNPFTGDVIVSAKCSNANSSSAATLKILGVYDATP